MRLVFLTMVLLGVLAGAGRAAEALPEGLIGQLKVSWVDFAARDRSIAYGPFRVLPSGVVVGRVVTMTRVADGGRLLDRARIRGRARILGAPGASKRANRMRVIGTAGKSRFQFVVSEIPTNPGVVRGRGWISVWGQRVTGIVINNLSQFPRRIVVRVKP